MTDETKDLTLCTCLLKEEKDPALHTINCKYRLRYDDIAMTLALTEDEVKVLSYILNMMMNTMTSLVNEERPEVLQALSSVKDKCQAGLKQLALIRTGQVEVKEQNKKCDCGGDGTFDKPLCGECD